jgi:hypothetical protein
LSDAVIFQLLNAAVMPGWALLLVAPRWRWTAPLISGCLLPFLLGVTYLVLLATGPRIEGGGFFTLEQVHTLFRSPHVVLVGWAHYLAFDLFVGSWEVRDAQRLGIAHWKVVPCLFFTLMFGPVGLVLYLTLRRLTRGHWVLSAQP